jgi:beta-lactamase regulating signal transducer with metallopeptidase domain
MIPEPAMLLIVKATIILVAALLLTRAMQRASAGTRHLVWLVTLVTLLLVPALAAWAPLRLEILPSRTSVASQRVSNDEAPAAPRSTERPAATVTEAPITVPEPLASPSALDYVRGLSLVTSLLSIWIGVALLIGTTLVFAWLAVRRIVRRAEPLTDPDWLTPLWEVSDRLGLEEPPRLLRSTDAKMPFACGVLHPTIVLPADCDEWTLDRRHAVLLHELAHVRRRDLVGHTLGRFVCAVYWFHPLVWTAAKNLRSESERACDDLALVCGARATEYAEHLLDIVTSVRRDATPQVALAMARPSEFEGRMLAILDPERSRRIPSRKRTASLVGTLALLSVVVGAAQPLPRVVTTVAAAPSPVAHPEPSAKPVVSVSSSASSSVATSTRTVVQRPQMDIEARIPNDVPLATELKNVVQMSMRVGVNAAAEALTSLARAEGAVQEKTPDERAELLAKVLRSDTSASLRRVAAWGLSEYAEHQVAIDALVNAVRRDANAVVREMAAWSLADARGSSAVIDALSAALRDSDVRVRATAAWALGDVGDASATDALVAALGDASESVRSRAIWALGNIEPRQAPRQLVAMLGDKDAGVRMLTAWALYEIEDPTTATALHNALRTEADKDLQIAYIRAMAAMGEKSVDAIRPLLESSDQRVKAMAVRALAGGHAAGPWPWPWPEPRPHP